jgi:uncharacterized coiled-coil protein SlyX
VGRPVNDVIQPGQGDLVITIKDVYLAQQEFSRQKSESDRKLTEIMTSLQITLDRIQNKMAGMDARNSAADELHREHGRRISDLERVAEVSGLSTLRQDRQAIIEQFENRISRLEAGVSSQEAVDAYKDAATRSRSTSRNLVWAVILAVATAIGSVALLVGFFISHLAV